MKAGARNIGSFLLASSSFHEPRPHCSFSGYAKGTGDLSPVRIGIASQRRTLSELFAFSRRV